VTGDARVEQAAKLIESFFPAGTLEPSQVADAARAVLRSAGVVGV